MTNKRFQRPIDGYSGSDNLLNKDKYQKDSQSVPKIAISSSKIDGDFNYVIDAVNTLDEDVKSIVYSGIANATILEEHISDKAVTESKIADNAITTSSLKNDTVTSEKIAGLSVINSKLANNCITKDKMALNSIGTQEVLDGAITRDKLAEDAISDSVPVGTIAQFSVDLLPTGWILCNGATLSKNTYPQLVKFLTNSDVELSADIPNLNTDENALSKYAIKAFSDTIELANIDIAGLTQDVAVLEPQVTANTLKGESTILWEGSASSGTLALSEPVTNFKRIEVRGVQSGSIAMIVSADVSNIAVENIAMIISITTNWRMATITPSNVVVGSGSGLYLTRITGIK